jgi:uncharacterized protein YidB (DUF937 family)
MGLFDTIASAIGQSGGEEGSSHSVLKGVLEQINAQPGGLSGLIQKFHEKGAGEVINSWVGTGENQPISGEQVKGIFGTGALASIAERAGISPDQAASAVSELLPHVVDHSTPDGQLGPGDGKLDFTKVMGTLSGLAGLFAAKKGATPNEDA